MHCPTGPGSHPVVATVTINVQDINDNFPEVTINILSNLETDTSSSSSDEVISTVPENNSPNTFVAQVTVVDVDRGVNGSVSCDIKDQKILTGENGLDGSDEGRYGYYPLRSKRRIYLQDSRAPKNTTKAHNKKFVDFEVRKKNESWKERDGDYFVRNGNKNNNWRNKGNIRTKDKDDGDVTFKSFEGKNNDDVTQNINYTNINNYLKNKKEINKDVDNNIKDNKSGDKSAYGNLRTDSDGEDEDDDGVSMVNDSMSPSLEGFFILHPRPSLQKGEAEYQLLASEPLDREMAPHGFKLTIACRDFGVEPKTSEKILTVKIIDENDNAPQFYQSHYETKIEENTVYKDKAILVLTAHDSDEGVNKQITYSTHVDTFTPSTAWKWIRVHEVSGGVFVLHGVDREEVSQISFKVPFFLSTIYFRNQLHNNNKTYLYSAKESN